MARDLERMPKAMAWRRRARGLNRRMGAEVRQLLAHPVPMDTPLRYREWMASMWMVWDCEEMAAMAAKAMGLSVNPPAAPRVGIDYEALSAFKEAEKITERVRAAAVTLAGNLPSPS